MNVAYNGVGEDEVEGEASKADEEAGKTENGESSKSVYKPLPLDEEGNLPNGRRKDCKGRVKVNEGDAWYVLLLWTFTGLVSRLEPLYTSNSPHITILVNRCSPSYRSAHLLTVAA